MKDFITKRVIVYAKWTFLSDEHNINVVQNFPRHQTCIIFIWTYTKN